MTEESKHNKLPPLIYPNDLMMAELLLLLETDNMRKNKEQKELYCLLKLKFGGFEHHRLSSSLCVEDQKGKRKQQDGFSM